MHAIRRPSIASWALASLALWLPAACDRSTTTPAAPGASDPAASPPGAAAPAPEPESGQVGERAHADGASGPSRSADRSAGGAYVPGPSSLDVVAVPPQPRFAIEPTGLIEPSSELLAEGQREYLASCAACHGAVGRADGPASYLLYPRPRDFRRAQYRFVSTWEGQPTDDDLFRSISRGIPGSSMPSWAHLPERSRWALVHYLKSLADEPIELTATDVEAGEGVIAPVAEPAADAASVARGQGLFQQHCAACHGPRGRGDGPNVADMKDAEGFPIRPRDLLTGVFKSSPEPERLYRLVAAGIPGTPMPSSSALPGADIWHLVHFVRSLSSDRLRERAEMRRYRVDAVRVARIPDHPDAGEWRQAPKVELHLMPLWWRYERPEYLNVQAVHDGKDLALLLLWGDDTENDMVIRPQDFRDAAAVQLSADAAPPFFAMGSAASPVNIWMWKAERQAQLKGFQDLEAQYPGLGIDSYPNLARSPYEQPMRHALTLDSDPTFVTAWGAGNIVSDPARRAGEDLYARGFGTLKARPVQQLDFHGVYSHGSYRVVFRRALAGRGDYAVGLRPGQTASVAFAVWNGAAGDRDGMKSVTIWQELAIQP